MIDLQLTNVTYHSSYQATITKDILENRTVQVPKLWREGFLLPTGELIRTKYSKVFLIGSHARRSLQTWIHKVPNAKVSYMCVADRREAFELTSSREEG